MIDLYRLISKGMRKQASYSYFITLHSFVSNQGNPIDFSARILGNRLHYAIVVSYPYSDASFYDGENFDEAVQYYVDMVSAFLSVSAAEKVAKMKGAFRDKARYLLEETSNEKMKAMNTPYQKKNSFLGLSEGV